MKERSVCLAILLLYCHILVMPAAYKCEVQAVYRHSVISKLPHTACSSLSYGAGATYLLTLSLTNMNYFCKTDPDHLGSESL